MKRGYSILVKFLVKIGADVNKQDEKGQTVLMETVEKEHFKLVKYLVEVGADKNKVDNIGRTALMKGEIRLYVDKFS